MKFIADFHIHSPHSRAVSKDMTLENLDNWARIKGIQVMGTGDFTHPAWFSELKTKLDLAEQGLYKLRGSSFEATRFLLTVEISSIYKKNGKVRKIHNLIFAPSLEIVGKINRELNLIGNIKSDGRPILGLDSKDLLKLVLNISPDCLLIPAHAWTPWFSIFGSMSGFDSIEECFDEYAKYIYAIETGLSSDPAMNWRLSALDKITLISNSDSHSLRKIGREANIFDANLSYIGIAEAIKNPRGDNKMLDTIEFFPEEGKYHYDGHSAHQIRYSPEETKKHQGICFSCGRSVTVGVMSRVEKLADRPVGFHPNSAVSYKSLVPLEEIIAEALGLAGVHSKAVNENYQNMIGVFGNEFKILLEASIEEIEKASKPEIAEGIRRVRERKLRIEPGYDGEFGKVKIFEKDELKKRFKAEKHASLFCSSMGVELP
ncbi:MAG: DNA helicase UvrD [Parcubacteria group bacterium]|nr:DNA helicase UvrD [Parcubacteria group bacterium]